MKNVRKVKNILFRVKIDGNGIVNFDDSDQQNYFGKEKNLRHLSNRSDNGFQKYNNAKYAKKAFFREGEDLNYKIKISSNALSNGIFREDVLFQSPNVMHNEEVLNSFIGSPYAMLKGYAFMMKEISLKRKSPITLTDAIQTCNAFSQLELCTRSGMKTSDADTSDNSLYKEESVGDITYQATGTIDLMNLQFVSGDSTFDRLAINPDKFESFKKYMTYKLPTFDSKLGYYMINNSVIQLPEFGFMFNNDNVVSMVKGFFERLLKMDIKRKRAFARTKEIEYKLVYDVLEDTVYNEDNWVKLTKDNLNDIDFEMQTFYSLVDKETAESVNSSISESKNTKSEKVKKDKADKKEQLDAAKKLKTTVNTSKVKDVVKKVVSKKTVKK